MMRSFVGCLFSVTLQICLAAQPMPIKHRIMVAQYQGPGGNRILEVSAEGKIAWEHKVPSSCVMFQALPNGNVVYAFGGKPTGAEEVDRDHKVVWRYESKSSQVLTCERLPNRNTLMAEQGSCQVVEVNPKNEIVSTVKLTTSEAQFHRQVRMIHRLGNGNILAAHEGEAVVREVTPAGKIVWEYPNVTNVFEAIRLPSGNTLIGCGIQRRIIEVTPEHKVVWELKAEDVPELNLTWITSLQMLRNGNLVVANFLRGQEGKGAHAFEVTRDKKIVWTFADHEMVGSLTMVHVLDDK
ncbi:MAG: hypothetical protein ABJF23_21845 [Bryobacteraceae bacterium]